MASHKSKQNISISILCICLLSVSLIGCGGRGKMTSNNSSYNGEREIIFTDNFIHVCNGSKIAEATAYDKMAGTISPVLVFYQGDAGKMYQDNSYSFPEDWKAEYPDIAKNQLVACITVNVRKEKRKCPFENDGKKYLLIMNDAKYNAKVYEAKTGTLVAEKDFDLKADKECPMFQFFTGSEAIEDPDYKQPMIDFLKPLVKH